MDYRQHEIAEASANTCNWILRHPNYSAWLHQHGLLWIKGNPGTGKSAFMKFALRKFKERGSGEGPIVAAFFFHGSGSLLQRSPVGLFRSLLHQLLTQIRPLLTEFRPIFE